MTDIPPAPLPIWPCRCGFVVSGPDAAAIFEAHLRDPNVHDAARAPASGGWDRETLAAALLDSDLIRRYDEYSRDAHPETMRPMPLRELALTWADAILAALGDVRLPETGLREAAERAARFLDHLDEYDHKGWSHVGCGGEPGRHAPLGIEAAALRAARGDDHE